MATIKAKGQQTTSVQGESEGADVFLRALRDGTAVAADWKQAAVMGGFGHGIFTGSFSNPAAVGGSASEMDLDRPRVCLSVPNGTSIVPLRIGVHVQSPAPADGNEYEILIAVDQDKEIPTDGTGTAATIYNMNYGQARASTCTARYTFTTTMSTDPVLDLELARKVVEYDKVGTPGVNALILDLVYEPETPPVINGPAALLVYVGGDAAGVGMFSDVQWLEFTESKFKV